MRRRAEAGLILVAVLWVLVILTMLALGIGRKVRVDTALARYAQGEARARAAAWAGVQYAAARIAQDSADPVTAAFDTRRQCGFRLAQTQTAEALFHAIPVPDGTADIVPSWTEPAGAGRAFGPVDEESRINLNALTPGNDRVLKFLLEARGFNEETADTVAASVLDWIDADRDVFNGPYGCEDGAKNLPFDHAQELLLVNGVTPEIYAAIAGDVTVFPRTGRLLINMDTAAAPVLQAWARNYAGARTNTEITDADALVEKILAFRRGADGEEGTADDRVVEGEALRLNQKERVLLMRMEGDRARISSFLRLGAAGTDARTGAVYKMDAVISRSGLRVVDSRRR